MTDLPSDIDMQGGFETPSLKQKPVATKPLTYEIKDADFWRLIRGAVKVFSTEYGIPEGAYREDLITAPESVTLRLTKVSDLASNNLIANKDTANPPICQCKTPTQGKQMEWGDQICGYCNGTV
jgi:hypothetical protein